MEIAARFDGTIVNADSMQVYADLRILTARPGEADEAAVPHRLYGHVPAYERYSVGRWRADVADVFNEVRLTGRVPIVVGGTGLYFRALTEGLAEIPPIPGDVRATLMSEAEKHGAERLHARLADIAPQDAARLRPGDTTRVVRALEVVLATGRPLGDWQTGKDGLPPLIAPGEGVRVVLAPERAVLAERIAARARLMLEAGAIDEVRALQDRRLASSLPAMKAIGVPEIGAFLDGGVSRTEALETMAIRTRQYAKRQMTWFRNRMGDWTFASHAPAVLDLPALRH